MGSLALGRTWYFKQNTAFDLTLRGDRNIHTYTQILGAWWPEGLKCLWGGGGSHFQHYYCLFPFTCKSVYRCICTEHKNPGNHDFHWSRHKFLSSVWKGSHFSFLEPKTSTWLLYLWKICGHLCLNYIYKSQNFKWTRQRQACETAVLAGVNVCVCVCYLIFWITRKILTEVTLKLMSLQ